MKLFSLIYGDIHTTTEDQKVIPANQYSLLLDAQEVLERAKQEREELLQKATAASEEIREQSKKEGFAEGLAQFSQQLRFFDDEIKRLRHEMQQAVLPIALQAAKKVVEKSLELHPELILDIVRQALVRVSQSRHITIYVHKSDIGFLEKEKPQLKALFEHLESLKILERNSLQPGSCVIETEAGIVNLTLEEVWKSIETAFSKYK